jgi:hypothetical protein
MEIVYESEGNPTMHVSARLPFEGETLQSIVEMFAPVRYWEELKSPVVVPEVGTTGAITVAPLPPSPNEIVPHDPATQVPQSIL